MFGWARAGSQGPDIAAISVVVISLVGIAFVFFPALASGATASGEITRAEASSDWTEGSFAGSVRWGSCEFPVTPFSGEVPGKFPEEAPLTWPKFPRTCQITPYATVAPGDDPAECWAQERQWPHSAGSQVLAWEGPTATFAGSATFDFSAVVLSGTPGQLLCLSVLQIREDPSPCAYQPWVFCAQVIVLVPTFRVAAAAVLPESGPAELFGPVPQPPGESESEETPGPGAEEEEEGLDEGEVAEQGQSAVPEPVPPPNAGGPGAAGASSPPAVRMQQRRCTRVHSHRSHKKGNRKHREHRSHKKCAPAPPG